MTRVARIALTAVGHVRLARAARTAADGDGHFPADGWANRQLPAPTVRAVVANVEDSAAFADRMRAETDRLDATMVADMTVPGDAPSGSGTSLCPSTWRRPTLSPPTTAI